MNECKMHTVHKKLCQKLLLNVRNNSLGNMHKVQMSETRAEPSANQWIRRRSPKPKIGGSSPPVGKIVFGFSKTDIQYIF